MSSSAEVGSSSGDAVAIVLALLAPRQASGFSRVVAIDGRSGTGKTTLAGELSPALGGAPVVHMDDLYPGWDGLDAAVPRLVEWVLKPLSAGRSGRYRRWDWAREAYAGWHDVPPSDVVVVEGVGSGARACEPFLTAVVCLEAPHTVRHARGMARDGGSYAPYWDRWAAQEDRHFAVEGTADRADVLLRTG